MLGKEGGAIRKEGRGKGKRGKGRGRGRGKKLVEKKREKVRRLLEF
jgi:hypothetical protein